MLNIHPATRNDIPALLSLIRGLAAYEKKPNAVVATEQDLLRDAFGPYPKFRALIAEWKGEPAGYASFFHFYSTYQGRSALFLEDLFVLDKFRGNGIGMSLLSAVAKLAIDESWMTGAPVWNFSHFTTSELSDIRASSQSGVS